MIGVESAGNLSAPIIHRIGFNAHRCTAEWNDGNVRLRPPRANRSTIVNLRVCVLCHISLRCFNQALFDWHGAIWFRTGVIVNHAYALALGSCERTILNRKHKSVRLAVCAFMRLTRPLREIISRTQNLTPSRNVICCAAHVRIRAYTLTLYSSSGCTCLFLLLLNGPCRQYSRCICARTHEYQSAFARRRLGLIDWMHWRWQALVLESGFAR